MLFETLGIVSQNLSPAKREHDTRASTDKRYLDDTISKQALRDLKFEWKQLRILIIQCTMENTSIGVTLREITYQPKIISSF